jgi:hypothetical protein
MTSRHHQSVEHFKYAIIISTNQNYIHAEICVKEQLVCYKDELRCGKPQVRFAEKRNSLPHRVHTELGVHSASSVLPVGEVTTHSL